MLASHDVDAVFRDAQPLMQRISPLHCVTTATSVSPGTEGGCDVDTPVVICVTGRCPGSQIIAVPKVSHAVDMEPDWTRTSCELSDTIRQDAVSRGVASARRRDDGVMIRPGHSYLYAAANASACTVFPRPAHHHLHHVRLTTVKPALHSLSTSRSPSH